MCDQYLLYAIICSNQIDIQETVESFGRIYWFKNMFRSSASSFDWTYAWYEIRPMTRRRKIDQLS